MRSSRAMSCDHAAYYGSSSSSHCCHWDVHGLLSEDLIVTYDLPTVGSQQRMSEISIVWLVPHPDAHISSHGCGNTAMATTPRSGLKYHLLCGTVTLNGCWTNGAAEDSLCLVNCHESSKLAEQQFGKPIYQQLHFLSKPLKSSIWITKYIKPTYLTYSTWRT